MILTAVIYSIIPSYDFQADPFLFSIGSRILKQPQFPKLHGLHIENIQNVLHVYQYHHP